MGSKRKIADEILQVIFQNSENSKTFIDAFCGSCSVIKLVSDSYKKIANDNNQYLIQMFKDLQNGREFPNDIDYETYNFYREQFHTTSTNKDYGLIGWIGFMASYNGRFYDGGYSGNSGGNGKGRNYIKEAISNINRDIPYIKNIEFLHYDYQDIDIPKNSIIYCDIPYKGTKKYTTYKTFDYDRFYQWAIKMQKEGNHVFISEYEMPKEFECIWEKKVTVRIGKDSTSRPIEKLFMPIIK